MRIVLTTRPIAGAALAPLHGAGAARYELLPFDEDALHRFAAKWFTESDAERFVRQVRDANLDELVRVPLLATIAAIIFEQDRDRRLPDNRYELYEAYLEYLRAARSIASAPWDQSRESLLEHLGRVRREEDTSLLAAAYDWAAANVPHICDNTNWRDDLTTYLTSVGPLVSRGGDLQFLHHSFAEHLAATAHARGLPDRFEPEAEEFVQLVHRARPGERGRQARLVLLHYTRLRQDQTNRLIEHLHTGNAAMQVLAARLLAWHAPASIEVTDAFLTKANAWAMTTQYPAQEILGQVSRAAHHPGLAGWLLDLMRDEKAPWESRIEAGRALAVRLYGPNRFDAVAMLRSVVEDQTIPVKFRSEAAKALADCGAGERAAAVTGLLSVLADNTATALQWRHAAIVLAGLGPEPRSRAIAVLTELLDDALAPQEDLIEAAMGLLEIGGGNEDRCADLFRTVLDRRNSPTADVRNAALGMASLGHHQLTEAVAALNSRLAEEQPSHVHVPVARVLAELGPEYRHQAGEKLSTLASHPRTGAFSRVYIASSLADFGPEFRELALDLLRAVSAVKDADPNTLLWIADAFMSLGPEYHLEAAQVAEKVAGHPWAGSYERTTAWGKVADLGEPHRTSAVRALQTKLADRAADPHVRVQAVSELFRLGPEFHAEAAQHVLEIASGRTADPQLRVTAWRTLQLLDTVYHHQASSALLDLMGPREANAWEAHTSEGIFYDDDTDPRAAATALTTVLKDPTRGVRHRVAAAHSLVNLGRHHHALAVTEFIELLERSEIPVGELSSSIDGFSEVSTVRRAELGQALASVVVARPATADLICETAKVLDELDVVDLRIDAAMRALRADESIAVSHRIEAAMVLARRRPAEVPAAATTMMCLHYANTRGAWTAYFEELAALGADLPEDVRTNTSIPDTQVWLRESCAGELFEIHPELRHEALTEIRSQASDEHLEFTWRTDAVIRLAALDPSTTEDAINFHRRVIENEREPVSHRCEAANQLMQLDVSQHVSAQTAVRRLARSTELSGAERANALQWLAMANQSPIELVPLARAIVHDPATSNTVRQRTSRYLPAPEFRAVSRAILNERTASIATWVETTAGYWDNWALASETEIVLRDALAGPETPPAERVTAAAALGRLSPRLLPEAVTILAELRASGRVRRQRLVALAAFDPAWRVHILTKARATLDAENRAWQHRLEAAKLLLALFPSPLTESDLARLARLVGNDRITGKFRLDLLQALERFDGIRALRDDERTPTATRWLAANSMRDYQRQDRERGARVLAAIADDPETRPPLRWRAAGDLAMFGAHGRKLAAERLRAMMIDETLPVLTRVHSARVLGDMRPDLRSEVLIFLRRLPTTNATARIHVVEAIGKHEPQEAALALRAMAEGRALKPSIRLRCAKAMSTLHRDYREPAAVVCRELAHNETVPRHIRAGAAKELALLSTLCRQEARELLTEIRANWDRQPCSRASAAAQSALPDGS